MKNNLDILNVFGNFKNKLPVKLHNCEIKISPDKKIQIEWLYYFIDANSFRLYTPFSKNAVGSLHLGREISGYFAIDVSSELEIDDVLQISGFDEKDDITNLHDVELGITTRFGEYNLALFWATNISHSKKLTS